MLPDGVFQGEELEKLHVDYDNWKQSVPFTETSKKENNRNNLTWKGKFIGKLR